MANEIQGPQKAASLSIALIVRYIKLGWEGRWEQLCLKDGTLRLGYFEVPHDLASSGDMKGLRQHFVDQGHKPPTATSHTNQVLSFYETGPETLWITFSAGYLWWAIAEGPVEFLGGSVEEMEERGSRLRRTRDGWHNSSVGGAPLRIPELSGALTKTANYQMTICSVDSLDYMTTPRLELIIDIFRMHRSLHHGNLTILPRFAPWESW